VRERIYASVYWKQHCFGLSAEGVVGKALELDAVGGMYGGAQRPTAFMCLALKLLQLMPEPEIALELLRTEDHKYVRLLGAFYWRLVARGADVYTRLEPLYNDWRRVRVRLPDGSYGLSHVDSVVDDMLRRDHLFNVSLPHVPARRLLERSGALEPRRSALDADVDRLVEAEEAAERAAREAAAAERQRARERRDEEDEEEEEEEERRRRRRSSQDREEGEEEPRRRSDGGGGGGGERRREKWQLRPEERREARRRRSHERSRSRSHSRERGGRRPQGPYGGGRAGEEGELEEGEERRGGGGGGGGGGDGRHGGRYDERSRRGGGGYDPRPRDPPGRSREDEPRGRAAPPPPPPAPPAGAGASAASALDPEIVAANELRAKLGLKPLRM
jgi:pre-mRNA-splicing factor 38A